MEKLEVNLASHFKHWIFGNLQVQTSFCISIKLVRSQLGFVRTSIKTCSIITCWHLYLDMLQKNNARVPPNHQHNHYYYTFELELDCCFHTLLNMQSKIRNHSIVLCFTKANLFLKINLAASVKPNSSIS